MIKTRRALAVAAVAVTATLTLAGCGGSSSEGSGGSVSITFAFWGAEDRADLTEQAVTLFEEENPDITVDVSYADFDSFTQRLTTQAAGGGLPEVFAVPSELLVQFARSGVIVDFADLDPLVDTSDIAEPYLEAGRVDDTQWGVPLGRAASAFIYNPEAWAAAGLEAPSTDWTLDDLAAASEAIVDSTGGETVGFTDFGKFMEYFQIYLVSLDKDLYTADGELGFTEQDLVDYWTITTGYVDDDLTTSAQVTTLFDGSMESSPLIAGASGGEVGAASLLGAYESALGSPVAAAPIPMAGEHSGLSAGVTSTAVISSTANDAQQAAAAKFLDFIVNDVDAGKILGLTRGLPPSQAVTDAISADLEGADLALYEYDKSIADIIQPIRPVFPAGVSTVKPEFSRIYDDLIFDRITVEEAAAQALRIFQDNL